MSIVESLLAISRSDLEFARAAAASSSEALLGPALVAYLDQVASAGVYGESSAFEEFISNGDNPNLYARTIEQLAQVHAELRPATVLDIGCEDRRVTAGVAHPDLHVHLLEPSRELLSASAPGVSSSSNSTCQHSTIIREGTLNTRPRDMR